MFLKFVKYYIKTDLKYQSLKFEDLEIIDLNNEVF